MPSHDLSSPPAPGQSTCRSCWLAAPGLLWMGLFFLVPLALVFAISFASRGTYGGIVWEFTAANYLDLWHPLYGKILGQSLWYASLTTAICFVLGFPLAYMIARSPARWQPVLLLLVMLPFWTNFLVRTYAWMIVLRQDGLVNGLLRALGIVDAPLELLYTPTAVVIGLVYGYLPFMVLPLYVAVERLDPRLVEAAWDLYASRWAIFTRVVVSSHDAGHRRWLCPGLHPVDRLVYHAGSARRGEKHDDRQSHSTRVSGRAGLAVGIGGVLCADGDRHGRGGAVLPPCRPDCRAVGGTMRRGSTGLSLVSGLAMLFLYGPILVLVLYSFNAAHLSMAWRGTTLKWYAALWHDEALLAATANSLLIAVISTIGATLLGGLMALGMERMPLRRQQIIEGGLVLPLVIPEVMMGVALMLLFVMLKMPLGLTTVILGHIVFNIPLVTIMIRTRLRKLDPALREAAADLGADSWQVFRHVTLPLLRPAIWGAVLVAFTVSLDDFLVTFFTAGPGATTLPLKVYSMIKSGVTPEINALSALLLLISMACVALSLHLQRREV
jgi:ABC-type spermidine/putrescine transport system permease subunit II